MYKGYKLLHLIRLLWPYIVYLYFPVAISVYSLFDVSILMFIILFVKQFELYNYIKKVNIPQK